MSKCAENLPKLVGKVMEPVEKVAEVSKAETVESEPKFDRGLKQVENSDERITNKLEPSNQGPIETDPDLVASSLDSSGSFLDDTSDNMLDDEDASDVDNDISDVIKNKNKICDVIVDESDKSDVINKKNNSPDIDENDHSDDNIDSYDVINDDSDVIDDDNHPQFSEDSDEDDELLRRDRKNFEPVSRTFFSRPEFFNEILRLL